MNYKLALYCKTYPSDFNRVVRLFESIHRYNKDKIPLYISCGAEFKGLLESKIGIEGYTHIEDESLYTPTRQMGGWEHQMLVKLNAFKGIPAENLLLLDSDAYFITDFYEQDFIAYGNVPYTIIHENVQVSEYEALLKGGDYSKTGYVKAVEAYRSIFQGKSNRVYDYGPNPHLWSRKVIEHFNTHYLVKNNLTLDEFCFGIKDQFNIHFRETLTYGEYLLATKVIDIVPCGPLFKVYHWKELYDFEMKLDWVKEEEIKKTYLGIIKQSNWS
jgi:hypothetical protein|tara:strand:+ start:2620 stop:3435 length:816 start_codon:yes stop_codon:yes gene_type:complete